LRGGVAIVLAWPRFGGEDEAFEAVPFETLEDERVRTKKPGRLPASLALRPVPPRAIEH